MARPKLFTEHLFPHVLNKPEEWGHTRTWMNVKFKWFFTNNELRRIFSGDPNSATPDEVYKVEKSLREYGQQHNFPGWQEISPEPPSTTQGKDSI